MLHCQYTTPSHGLPGLSVFFNKIISRPAAIKASYRQDNVTRSTLLMVRLTKKDTRLSWQGWVVLKILGSIKTAGRSSGCVTIPNVREMASSAAGLVIYRLIVCVAERGNGSSFLGDASVLNRAGYV